MIKKKINIKPDEKTGAHQLNRWKITKTPGVIPSNLEPEHKIVFGDNKDGPDIETLSNDLRDEDDESNPDTWNVFDDPEVDSKVDISKQRVTRYDKVFGIH